MVGIPSVSFTSKNSIADFVPHHSILFGKYAKPLLTSVRPHVSTFIIHPLANIAWPVAIHNRLHYDVGLSVLQKY
jgi:hypothetical protein